jgi:hypothetical protein
MNEVRKHTSLPCEWLASITVVAGNEEEPMSRSHLILLYRTCRQLVLIIRHSRELVAQELFFSRYIIRCDEEDVGYVVIAPFEIRCRSEVFGRLGVDEVGPFIDEVNTI